MKNRFRSVMVIDDNQIDLYVAARIITKNNFADEIVTFSSGADALEFLRKQSEIATLPEILFVDIYMPGMSGFEFMDAFAQLPQFIVKYCRAYIVSSTIDDTDIVRTREHPHIEGFQEKPISADFLAQIPS